MFGIFLNSLFSLNYPGIQQDGSKPEFSERITNKEMKIGEEVRFTCMVFGTPTPNIEWYKDDEFLQESSKIKFESKDGYHSLILRDITFQDEAEYKALARNPLGTATCTSELLVEERIYEPEFVETMKDIEVIAHF